MEASIIIAVSLASFAYLSKAACMEAGAWSVQPCPQGQGTPLPYPRFAIICITHCYRVSVMHDTAKYLALFLLLSVHSFDFTVVFYLCFHCNMCLRFQEFRKFSQASFLIPRKCLRQKVLKAEKNAFLELFDLLAAFAIMKSASFVFGTTCIMQEGWAEWAGCIDVANCNHLSLPPSLSPAGPCGHSAMQIFVHLPLPPPRAFLPFPPSVRSVFGV